MRPTPIRPDPLVTHYIDHSSDRHGVEQVVQIEPPNFDHSHGSTFNDMPRPGMDGIVGVYVRNQRSFCGKFKEAFCTTPDSRDERKCSFRSMQAAIICGTTLAIGAGVAVTAYVVTHHRGN